jgi:hypothetical protein
MRNFMKVSLSIIAAMVMIAMAVPASAQNESDVAAFIRAGQQDANALITGYTNPLIKAASYGATGGWFTTAKTHKKLGFDLSVSGTVAFTPKKDDYFTPTGLSSNTTFKNNTNPGLGAPTFLGPKDETTYTITGGGQTATFNGPEGLDLRHNLHFAGVPVPMIQLGIGTIKNTDLKIRYIPSIKRGDSKVSMFGLGLMHDIKQYLPGSEFLPFDLSVLVGYNSIKGETSLISDGSGKAPQSADGNFHYKLNSWVGQAIISKKLAAITFYAAAGYGSVTTNADITGTFTYDYPVIGSASITDPYATKFKNKSAKLTAGARLKLGPVYLVGDYTLQKYNALTLGLGLSIR